MLMGIIIYLWAIIGVSGVLPLISKTCVAKYGLNLRIDNALTWTFPSGPEMKRGLPNTAGDKVMSHGGLGPKRDNQR